MSILESTVFNPFTKLSIPDFILVDAEDNCFKSLDEVDTLLSDDCIVFNALNTSLEPLVKLDDFEFNWSNPSCIVFIPSVKVTAPSSNFFAPSFNSLAPSSKSLTASFNLSIHQLKMMYL